VGADRHGIVAWQGLCCHSLACAADVGGHSMGQNSGRCCSAGGVLPRHHHSRTEEDAMTAHMRPCPSQVSEGG
jgi:hypothetical protein